MNSFSLNRFCKTFHWFFSMNLRSLLMWTGGFTVAIFLAGMMVFFFNPNNPKAALGLVSTFDIIFIFIGLFASVSSFLSDYDKKPKREAFLMVPASNLEKYLSAVIYAVTVFTFALFLSVVLGDTLRMVFRSLVYGDEWLSAVPKVMRGVIPNIMVKSESPHVYSLSYEVMNFVVGFSLILWLHSLYTLGGTLFRKYAFVATSVVMISCTMLLSWIINHFDVSMFTSHWDGDKYVSQEVGFFAYVLAVVLPLLSIFNYWASFHIFKGFQLITNKWTNYDILKR